MTQLKFRDGKFKIMQIADIQECAQVSPDTIRLITKALEAEKQAEVEATQAGPANE